MCHVLVIEDESLIASLIVDILEDAGATSFAFAESEADAISEARAHRPDLITSDVRLRQGTGPRAVRTILDEGEAIPVIFVTGNPEECRDYAMPAEVLTKPIVYSEMVSTFRRLASLS